MKRFAFTALVFITLACGKKTDKKNEKAILEQISIVNMRGEILRQSSYSFQWKQLSGPMTINSGDLLSLGENSSARLFYEGRIRAVVEIKGPTLFRVDRNAPTASAFKSINTLGKNDKNENAQTQTSGVLSQIQTKPLNFLWPTAPMVIVSKKYPLQTSVAVALPHLDSRLIASVYDLSRQKTEVWSGASQTGKFNKITIPRSGTYRLIVRSEDGRYLNESLTIEAKTQARDILQNLQNRVVEFL